MIIPVLPSPTTVYWRTLPLIVLGWILVLLAVIVSLPSDNGPFVIGVIFGTVFQQSILAAAWAALGPGKLLFRMPVSFGWACLMGSAIALPIAVREQDMTAVVFMLTTAGFWFVGQFPIWLAVALFGLRLRYQGAEVTDDDAKQRQFGIAQLMIFTTFVAVLLGIGRILIARGWLPKFEQEIVLLLGLLLCAQVLISLPLMFGAWLRKGVVAACILGIVFGAIVTGLELPVIRQAIRGPMPPTEYSILIWMNVTSALWVLIFAAVVRFSGYQFGSPEISKGIYYLEPAPASPLPAKSSATATEVLHIRE